MQLQLEMGHELYKMLKTNPKIRESVMSLAKKIIEMIHSERYKLSTLEFKSIVPLGENNKIFMVLQKGEYCTDPLQVYEPPKDSATMALVNFVSSLFTAICGENGEMAGFIHCCDGLCSEIYNVARYIYTFWYQYERRDLIRPIIWQIGDGPEQKEWVSIPKPGADDCPLCHSSPKYCSWVENKAYGYIFSCKWCGKSGMREFWPTTNELVTMNDLVIYGHIN